MVEKDINYWKRKSNRKHLPQLMGFYAYLIEEGTGSGVEFLDDVFNYSQNWALKNFDKGRKQGALEELERVLNRIKCYSKINKSKEMFEHDLTKWIKRTRIKELEGCEK